MGMTREERLELLKQIEKDIHVCSLESTFLEDAKSCAIHSVIEEFEQEPTNKNDLGVEKDFVSNSIVEKISEQVTETHGEFIFETIRPYCENVVQMKISKRDLEQALLKYYGKNNLGVDCIARQDVERYIEGFINEYTPKEELEFINLELDGLKHLPSATPQEPKWILTTEQLPKDRDWYLGIFKEPDTGWINPLPFICDYVGRKTKATTKEYWILRGFTDIDEPCDYYLNLECVAWMPLPQPYKAGGVE